MKKPLLRVAQEALGNVIKHAAAKEIQLRLYTDENTCYLSVKDDGQGFTEGSKDSTQKDSTQKDNTHMGLRTMRERVQTLGGDLQIHSNLGEGTLVSAVIPLKKVS